MNVAIRGNRPDDAASLYAVFFQAIHIGAASHYSHAQRHAWAPSDSMPPTWPDRLAALDTRLACKGDKTLGFMAATPDGHVELAFVRPRWMGRSVAQALHDDLIERARARGLSRLTTHASHLARRFLARNGWQVDHPETVDRNGVALDRFAMSLTLDPTP